MLLFFFGRKADFYELSALLLLPQTSVSFICAAQIIQIIILSREKIHVSNYFI